MIISRDWWVNSLINDRKIQRALWVETSPLRDDAERRREMVQWVRAGFSLQDEANQKKIGLLQPAHVLWTLQPTRRRRQRGRREDGDGSLRSGSYLLTLTSLWSCEALGAVPLSHSCSAVPLSFYIFTKKSNSRACWPFSIFWVHITIWSHVGLWGHDGVRQHRGADRAGWGECRADDLRSFWQQRSACQCAPGRPARLSGDCRPLAVTSSVLF